METLFNQFSQVLGTTLLHSLWQALVMYASLRIFLACFPGTLANNKYKAGLLSLTGSVLWPIITFISELNTHSFIQPITAADTTALPFIPIQHGTITATQGAPQLLNIDAYLPYLVTFWLLGIALNSARLLWGLKNIYQIKHQAIGSPVLRSDTFRLSRMLKIKKAAGAFVSDYVDVPCIIGYFKPMIILPAAVITQFGPDQIQSILVHELAHIRRNDYFVNVLQQITGIVFFFNPFTLLINRIIYTQREHCCDDLVLQVTGQPLVYAQTLLQLEESRKQTRQLALAATGKKYHLLTRIKRIMETKKQPSSFKHILVAILLLTCSMGTIAWLNPDIKNGKLVVKPVPITTLLNTKADTAKKHSTTKKSAAANKSISTNKGNSKNKVNISYSAQYNPDDPKLSKLMADVEKHAEAIGKIYDSPQYRKIEKEMEKRSAYIDSFYNRPELKQLQDSLNRQSDAFRKISENPEMKDLEKQMEELGKKIGDYYNQAEYKDLTKAMELQGKLLADQNGSMNADYDKQRETYNKIAERFKAYNNNPALKKMQEDLREAGKKMRDYYNTDAYKAQRDAMNKLGASIRASYQSPAIKQQTAELRKLSAQLRAYSKSPEALKQKEELKKAQAALNAYRNSPEFKKHQQKIQAEVSKLMKNMQYNVKTDTTSSGK